MRHSLHIDSVQKRFGCRTLLSDVFLQCHTGDVIGIFGRNGSGKSTLLNIISGVLSAEQSYVKVDGLVISSHSRAMNYICCLPQRHFIPEYFTVRKAVSLSLAIEQVALLLEDRLLSPVLDQRIRDLSGGERRYLEIMLVLNHTAPFILLDEPFNGLSPLMKEVVCDRLTGASSDKGIIITDHDYENVLRVATSKLLLKGGALRSIASASELAAHGYLTPSAQTNQ